VDEFTRVQNQFDTLALQEELKQMMIENKLFKEKINSMMESFKRIEEKRDSYIKEMEGKVSEAQLITNSAEDRKKAEAK
jgi:hypothetical protein